MIGNSFDKRRAAGSRFSSSERIVSIAHGHAVIPTTSTPSALWVLVGGPRLAVAFATSRYGSRLLRPHGEALAARHRAPHRGVHDLPDHLEVSRQVGPSLARGDIDEHVEGRGQRYGPC